MGIRKYLFKIGSHKKEYLMDPKIEHPRIALRSKQKIVNDIIINILTKRNLLSSREIFEEARMIDEKIVISNIKSGIKALKKSGKIGSLPVLEDMRMKRFFVSYDF